MLIKRRDLRRLGRIYAFTVIAVSGHSLLRSVHSARIIAASPIPGIQASIICRVVGLDPFGDAVDAPARKSLNPIVVEFESRRESLIDNGSVPTTHQNAGTRPLQLSTNVT